MNDTRPALFTPVPSERNQTPAQVTGRVSSMIADARAISLDITHRDWLQELRKGDFVLVRNRLIHYRTPLTDATPCYLHVGKLKFRRDSGWIILRQQRFGTKLLLVRNEQEFIV